MGNAKRTEGGEMMTLSTRMRRRVAASGKRPRDRRGEAGFTLVELLVVMVILVLLASLVAPRVIGYLGSSRTKTAKVQIESLSTSLELYKLDTGRYPDRARRSGGARRPALRRQELERPLPEEGQGSARSVGAPLSLPLSRPARRFRHLFARRRRPGGWRWRGSGCGKLALAPGGPRATQGSRCSSCWWSWSFWAWPWWRCRRSIGRRRAACR